MRDPELGNIVLVTQVGDIATILTNWNKVYKTMRVWLQNA